jgi:hypothetical protein
VMKAVIERVAPFRHRNGAAGTGCKGRDSTSA